ncbi:MAG: tRNA uridine-5-carboxymethylaminomethyl(34) synthesis GTPase MnmE [Rhodospirillales bacterium RIFCSPLOWO2_12_FULL_58_28]|nr:MAG: tRNA uridine-5-carboxymethylaminomethyl(34) synthesis GTPase MnmE [Rhodospirillales bacterium RIFCSPLOWO2_02_FULL_58_16]OHC77382.1 MAG: tRNA uridine-5-carboxymethylaminomethyl(34) synthesis GTPase MnmE [Rhodospirillales bacterium RIFCSPLOWO2_12_FULL_58_28]
MKALTIYAPAGGGGRAGIAVIRVSGPQAGKALQALSRRELPPARRATRAGFHNPVDGVLVDEGLALWFPAPSSFTGEDVAEMHVHGGRAVLSGMLNALGACEGLRLAEPGEFSRRAFENDKFDLTAAEGLADLINAETEAQRRQALRQMQGELGRLYESWRQSLMAIIADIEATIDFSDEDLPVDLFDKVIHGVDFLLSQIIAHLGDGKRGEILHNGLHLAIIGPPNAGKSSMMNLLTRRNAAIVSDLPGTTRDVIEVRLDIAGYPVVVADTAGLCESGDKVEMEGVRRARAWAEGADLKLVIFDAKRGLDPLAAEYVNENALVVINKIDLNFESFPKEIKGYSPRYVSVLTGEGIEEMAAALERMIAGRCQISSSPSLTQARHRQALEQCRDSLIRCRQTDASELVAEDLRLAARALGRITGRVDVEDILDVIFKDFCIGK